MKTLLSQNGVVLKSQVTPLVFVCNNCGASYQSDEYKAEPFQDDLSQEDMLILNEECPTCFKICTLVQHA